MKTSILLAACMLALPAYADEPPTADVATRLVVEWSEEKAKSLTDEGSQLAAVTE